MERRVIEAMPPVVRERGLVVGFEGVRVGKGSW